MRAVARAVLAVLLLLAAALATGAPAQAASATTASITGTVRDPAGVPVGAGAVCVLPRAEAGGPYRPRVLTDDQGRYRIDDLPPGPRSLQFEDCDTTDADYAQRYYDSADYEQRTVLDLVAGEERTGIDTRLEASSSIRGHVYEGAGTDRPVGTCVQLQDPETQAYVRYAETQADGSYVVGSVAPGRYVVLLGECGSGARLMPQHWPDSDTFEGAQPITITPGTRATGIDGHLHPGGALTGTAFDVDGQRITSGDICVRADGLGGAAPDRGGYAQTDVDGRFAMPHMLDGTYAVSFEPCYYASTRHDLPTYLGGGSSADGSVLITLARDEARDHIDVRLRRDATIGGRITDAGTGAGLADACVGATAVDPYGPVGSSSGSARTAADGTYVIQGLEPGLPGGYRVSASDCSASPAHVPRSFGGDGSREQATPVMTTLAAPARGVDIALGPGGTLTGTVRDAAGRPITTQDVCVSIDDDDGDRLGGSAGQQPDASGTFRFPALPAAAYSLRTSPCGDDSRNDVPASLPHAATVVVGATTTFDVRVQPGTTITGRTFLGRGTATPQERTCVRASPSDADLGDPGYAYSEADGSYELRHVAPGEVYSVSFAGCYSDATYQDQDYALVGDSPAAARVIAPATGIDAHLVAEDAAPDTRITSAPAEGRSTRTRTPTIAFTSDASYASYECSLDGAAYARCSSPYAVDRLAVGPHAIRVRAANGTHVDPTPATRSWTVDPSVPATTLEGSVIAPGLMATSTAYGAEATTTEPLVVRVSVPEDGTVTAVHPTAVDAGGLVAPYDLSATAAQGTRPMRADATTPFRVDVTVDASVAADQPSRVVPTQDGRPIAACAGAGLGPDPCLARRRVQRRTGDQLLEVRATALGRIGLELAAAGSTSGAAAPATSGERPAASAPASTSTPAPGSASAPASALATGTTASPTSAGPPAASAPAPSAVRVAVLRATRRGAVRVRLRSARTGPVQVRLALDAATVRRLGRTGRRAAAVVRRVTAGPVASAVTLRLPAGLGRALVRLPGAGVVVRARPAPSTAWTTTVRARLR